MNNSWEDDCDPISLEPLNELPYPPFELQSGSHTLYCDGKVLAMYVVSTGRFLNPMNRAKMTRQDCVRLDRYLEAHRVTINCKVSHAYDLQQGFRIDNSSGDGEMLRRAAATLFLSLFKIDSIGVRNCERRNRFRNQSAVLHQEGNLTIVDDDEWIDELENDFETHFPALISSNRSMPLNSEKRSRGTARRRIVTQSPNHLVESRSGDTCLDGGVLSQYPSHVIQSTPGDISFSKSLRQRTQIGRKTRELRQSKVSVNSKEVEEKNRKRQKWRNNEMTRRLFRKRILVCYTLLSVVILGVVVSCWGLAVGFICLLGEVCCFMGIALFIDSKRVPLNFRHILAGLSFAERSDCKFGITFFGLGTRGDIEPLLAVALNIMKTYPDVRVLICAPADFECLASAHGIPFASCGIKSIHPSAKWHQARSITEFLVAAVNEFIQDFDDIASSFWHACIPCAANEYHHTDAIVAGTFALNFALDITETLHAPLWAFKFAPDTPTAEFPPFGENPYVGNFFNRARYLLRGISAVRAMNNLNIIQRHNSFRDRVLGLPDLTLADLDKLGKYTPSIYGFSRHLISKPSDWPMHHIVAGFCSIRVPSSEGYNHVWKFIKEYSKRPICINFGSMYSALFDSGVVTRCIQAALSLEGRGCIIVCANPPLNLQDYAGKDSNVLLIDSIPHDLLFPKCACVIHHGGAG